MLRSLVLGRVRSMAHTRAVRMVLAVVALAIVGVQSAGFVHRVAHSTAQGWLYAAAGDAHDAAGAGATHDCVAVDALALGGAPPAALPTPADVVPPAARSAPVCAPLLRPARASPFRARAPPVLS